MKASQPTHPYRITKTLVGGSSGYGIYEVIEEDGQGGRKAAYFELVAPGGEFITPTHGTKDLANAVMLARIARLAAVFKRDQASDEDPDMPESDDESARPRP